MSKAKKFRFIGGLAILVVTVLLVACWFLWRPATLRAQCRLQLRNYDTYIASCGMDRDADVAWKDPKRTELLVRKRFSQDIPKCPAGGECSIVYGRKPPHEWLPRLRCTMEETDRHYCENAAISNRK